MYYKTVFEELNFYETNFISYRISLKLNCGHKQYQSSHIMRKIMFRFCFKQHYFYTKTKQFILNDGTVNIILKYNTSTHKICIDRLTH